MASQTQVYFVNAPFAITASPEAALYWADRTEVLERLQRLCRAYRSRPDSSLDLMWANLGAGKTHALLHLRHLLTTQNSDIVTVYAEMPEQPRRFLDLYQRIARDLLAGSGHASLPDSCPGIMSDVMTAMRACRHGSMQQRDVALDWITGGRPQLKELKAIGISSRIEDDTRACDVLAALVQLHAAGKRRVVLLIDEFQRLNTTKPITRESILANLRSVFSMNSTYFSVVLAATSLIEKSAVDLLPQELQTLTGLKPKIRLPEMNRDEAIQFLTERLSFYRPPGYKGEPYEPFGKEGISTIVDAVANGGKRLIPRTLLQLTGMVYDEITSGGLTSVSQEGIQALLDDEPD